MQSSIYVGAKVLNLVSQGSKKKRKKWEPLSDRWFIYNSEVL